MHDYGRKVQAGMIVSKKLHKSTYENAAKTIQRAWRIYAARKRMRNRIARTEELLGMTIPSWKSQEVFEKDKKNFQKKLTLMPVFADRIAKESEKERARVIFFRINILTSSPSECWIIGSRAVNILFYCDKVKGLLKSFFIYTTVKFV